VSASSLPRRWKAAQFTITNLGGDRRHWILSDCESSRKVAILGLFAFARMEPEWVNNKFEPRLILPLSLSYDHRLIDGADAARFPALDRGGVLRQPFLLSVQGVVFRCQVEIDWARATPYMKLSS